MRAAIARLPSDFRCSAAMTRRVRARQIKVSTRHARRARRFGKNYRPAKARAANHSALIRSFFARFRSAHSFCAANLENYFCLCRCRRCARARRKTERARTQIFVRAAATREYHRCKKSLLHRAFCDAENLRARTRRAFVSHVVVSHARMMNDVAMCVTVARIHGSLSQTLFFSLRCSKRNAVRVDPRPY